MEQIIEAILGLAGVTAYVIIGVLAFAESAAFVGLFVPGELAVLLGGVLASQGRVSLGNMVVVAAAGAIAGDSAGYEIGRRYGRPLLGSRLMRRYAGSVRQAESYLQRHGGPAIFLGRWTSVLRALVPGLAGMGRMPYRRFMIYNALGGVAWAAAFTFGGYDAGASFRQVEAVTGRGSWILAGVLVVAAGTRWAVRHVRGRRSSAEPGTGAGQPEDHKEVAA